MKRLVAYIAIAGLGLASAALGALAPDGPALMFSTVGAGAFGFGLSGLVFIALGIAES